MSEMSLRALTWVWDHSREKGGTLLLQLAIADYAHDDGGGAWPSIPTLSRKARMTPRNVQLRIATLVSHHELEVEYGAGPNGVNIYRLLMGGETVRQTVKTLRGEKSSPVKKTTNRGEKFASGGVKNSHQGVIPGSPDPSLDPLIRDPLLDPDHPHSPLKGATPIDFQNANGQTDHGAEPDPLRRRVLAALRAGKEGNA